MAQPTRYAEDIAEVDFLDEELSEGISVRLTPSVLRQLRYRAKSMGIGPSTLARMWILERLSESEGSPARQVP